MGLNNFRTEHLIWDRVNSHVTYSLETNSGDSNGRKLRVQVLDGGVVTALSGVTLSLAWKTANQINSGLDAFKLVDVALGIFEIYYTTEMLSNVGKLKASLVLVDATGRMESDTFPITVNPTMVDDNAVQGENSFTALTEALVKVNEWNGRIDDVEQDYADRAENLEETYAPRLTEVTAQLALTATQSQVDALEIRTEAVIQSADLDPNKDQELVDARFGKATLGAKVREIDSNQDLVEEVLFDDKAILDDYSNIPITGKTTLESTRIIRNQLSKNTYLLSVNMNVITAGSIKIKALRKNVDDTFSFIGDIKTANVSLGNNKIVINYRATEDVHLAVYLSDAQLGSYEGMSYSGNLVTTGELNGTVTPISSSHSMAFSATTAVDSSIEKTNARLGDVDVRNDLIESFIFDKNLLNNYLGESVYTTTVLDSTRIMGVSIPKNTRIFSANVHVAMPGQIKIKRFRKNSDNTFTLINNLGIYDVSTGENTIALNAFSDEECYIGFHSLNARVNVGTGGVNLFVSGDLTGTSAVSTSSFKLFLSLNTMSEVTKIEKNLNETINAEIEELRSELGQPTSVFLYSNNLMQIFPENTTIGDSLVAGFTNANGANMGSVEAAQTKNNWPGFLALRTGRSFANIAVGGSTARDWRNTHVLKADVKTDCYWIALGVNDLRGTLSIGTTSDILADRNNNADTFYGNYDYVVRQAMSYNPNARAFVFTIPPHEGVKAVDYNVAIRHVASLYDNVHLIDLHEIYYEEYTTGFLPNNFINGHYTPLTYNYISTLIEKAVNDYIFNNYDNFITVPYV